MTEDRDYYYERKLLRSGGSMKGCLWSLAWTVALLAAALLCGCRSVEYVPVTETRTEHHWHADTFIRRDSIVSSDSVWVERRGDTLTIDRWHTLWRDRWRERVRTDTVHIADTVPRIVVREVERRQGFGDRLSTFAVDATIGIILLIVFFFVFRLFFRKRLRR